MEPLILHSMAEIIGKKLDKIKKEKNLFKVILPVEFCFIEFNGKEKEVRCQC